MPMAWMQVRQATLAAGASAALAAGHGRHCWCCCCEDVLPASEATSAPDACSRPYEEQSLVKERLDCQCPPVTTRQSGVPMYSERVWSTMMEGEAVVECWEVC